MCMCACMYACIICLFDYFSPLEYDMPEGSCVDLASSTVPLRSTVDDYRHTSKPKPSAHNVNKTF